MPRFRSLFGLSAAAIIFAAACSSGGTAATQTASDLSAAPTASATSAAGGGSPTSQVSANSASEPEIAAALAAAGVSNADRWAREVVEYRPYDASDSTLQKLQDNLAKYNPDPTTLAGILSALVP